MTNLAHDNRQAQSFLDTLYEADMDASLNQMHESVTLCRAQIDCLKAIASDNSIGTGPSWLAIVQRLENHVKSLQEDLDIFKAEFAGE